MAKVAAAVVAVSPAKGLFVGYIHIERSGVCKRVERVGLPSITRFAGQPHPGLPRKRHLLFRGKTLPLPHEGGSRLAKVSAAVVVASPARGLFVVYIHIERSGVCIRRINLKHPCVAYPRSGRKPGKPPICSLPLWVGAANAGAFCMGTRPLRASPREGGSVLHKHQVICGLFHYITARGALTPPDRATLQSPGCRAGS